MPTTTAQRLELEQIDAILATGATATNADGVSVSFDLPSLRRRRAELRRLTTPARRPRVATLNISRAQG